jgi:hypothetical protein
MVFMRAAEKILLASKNWSSGKESRSLHAAGFGGLCPKTFEIVTRAVKTLVVFFCGNGGLLGSCWFCLPMGKFPVGNRQQQ